MLANMPNNQKPTMERLNDFVNQLKNIDIYRQISSVLSWDQETMMPSGSIKARADQLATLAGKIHDLWNDPILTSTLEKSVDLDKGTPLFNATAEEAAFIREIYPIWKRNTQLSKKLITELSEVTSIAQHQWQEARETNNFALFAPHLERIIELQKEKVAQLGYEDHPYNTLLDEYEPGMTVSKIEGIFTPLKEKTLSKIANEATSSPKQLQGPFDSDQQMVYSRQLVNILNYDLDRGRLDLSTHPFTIDIHTSDVRITTRVSETNFFESFSSTIHEIGHGLYEQGLDSQWVGTPFGTSRSMGVHESQSRLWEIFICQSLPFWEGQLPTLQKMFPAMKQVSANDLYEISHQITPHWCRVESDVVTYNMHIILRYECEKALIEGSLAISDLPELWNQKMKDYLGITIESDTKGCLQDVHWSAGLFGYFPTYTLGTLMAEQIYKKLEQEFSNLEDLIRNANFIPIKEWLNNSIHQHGCRYTTDELTERIGINLLSKI